MSKHVVFQEGTHSFYGVLKIKVIYGTISIFGATVGKGFSDKIFSPFHQLAIPIQSDKPFCIEFSELQENELHPNELPFYDSCPDEFTEIIPFVYHSYGNKGPKYPNKLIKKINEILISNQPARILLYGGKGIGKSTLSNFLVNMLKSFPPDSTLCEKKNEEEKNENNNEEKNEEEKDMEETMEDKGKTKEEKNDNEKQENNNDTDPKYYHFINEDSIKVDNEEEVFLYNRKVAFVDLDPGQPEISYPTIVSFTKDCPFLFGSSEHHSTFADECYTVSTTNLSHAISNFTFTTNLFSRNFNSQNSDNPKFVVINSHGWVENDGFQLQLSIIKSFNPDLVICLYKSSNPPPKKFTKHQFNVRIKPIREICHPEPINLRNARIERYFMMKRLNMHSIPTFSYLPISSLEPIHFPIKRFRYSFPYEINIMKCFSQIPRILNCSIISFCIDNSKYKNENIEKLLFPLVSPKAMKCVGLGFVRAIDVQNETIYIITPESNETLNRANTIMYISSNLPISFLRDSNRFYLPYHNLFLSSHLSKSLKE